MQDIIRVHDRTFRPYIRREEIEDMVNAIAESINRDFAGRELTMVVILRGALVFAADLMRKLNMAVTVEVVRASSYRDQMSSSGTVTLDDVVPDITGRHVLIVEDIVDSGTTMRELIKHLSSYEPASLNVAALLSKPDLHQGRIQIDYVGREIAPDFVVGYGLDYAGHGRNLDAIWIVDEN
jgi:hypoxanthine phosphoribosyltransferase